MTSPADDATQSRGWRRDRIDRVLVLPLSTLLQRMRGRRACGEAAALAFTPRDEP